MNLQTKVELPKGMPAITHQDRILLMGSCFAENMGKWLAENKFNVDVNPYGILYNPLSIARALREIEQGAEYEEEDLFFHNECWHSPMHHGSFSAPTAEETLANINTRLSKASEEVDKLDWLIIALGTAYVYRNKETEEVVANCHKLPDSCFEKNRLDIYFNADWNAYEDAREQLTRAIDKIKRRNPNLKVLFTVSPIRHLSDGLRENQISKATLLLMINEIQEIYEDEENYFFYFPAYEIMLDELRDYRFYADDMVHPSPLAIDYLQECFSKTFFSDDTRGIVAEVEEIRKALEHKPFHPESKAYQRFLEQIMLKIEQLRIKCPYLDFQKELALCHTLLNP